MGLRILLGRWREAMRVLVLVPGASGAAQDQSQPALRRGGH
jgi:hypothetical protein